MNSSIPPILKTYFDSFESYLNQQAFIKTPKGLEIPIAYTIKNGGKRIRPIFVLLIADTFSNGYAKALDAAISVELFHNFTLIHDDVMDRSLMRRGQVSVHEKWNTNTAILAGDALLVKAYQQLNRYRPKVRAQMFDLLSSVARTVCDGQYLDIAFESKSEININQYIDMITKKTAYLFGCSFKLGGLVSSHLRNKANELFKLGILLGKIFQIQDDYLDVFGNPESFGKTIGGDIRQAKKTILFTQAMKLGSENQKKELLSLYDKGPNQDSDSIVERVIDLFRSTKADVAAKKLLETYLESFSSQINQIGFPQTQKQKLTHLLSWIACRKN